MIAVGGSTTECYYLSDGKDWPNLLENKLTKNFDNIWVNNAGLDGHSTFGHYILLTDYLIDIKPDFILYLVGSNDVGREDLGEFDKYTLQGEYFSFKNWFIENSELIGLIVNISRVFRARRINLLHSETILTELEHTQNDLEIINKELLKHQPYVSLYRDRLIQLVKKTKENSILPILITQPTLVGKGVDNETGINLETVKLMSEHGGKAYWMILEQYNEVTRQVAKQENIIIIDLASKLPKDSKYFYDVLHFTNEGAEKVSEIIAEDLGQYLMSSIQGNQSLQ